MELNQGQVGVSMALDPGTFPKISSNSKANDLLRACSAAFTWGAKQGMNSAENPPVAASRSGSEKELVKAAALAGQATENASKSVKWNAKQQDEYAAAYGQALARGLEDSLSGKAPNTSYKGPASIDPAWAPNLQAIYSAAYGVYGSGQSGAGGTGGQTDAEVASSLGTSLLIAVAATAAIAGGLYWYHVKTTGKSEARANPSEMVLYQINDEEESVTLQEFLADNRELDPEDVEKIRSLDVGETGHFGGGAFAEWKIRRVY